jgi:sec-independent protein translocase protein TatA
MFSLVAINFVVALLGGWEIALVLAVVLILFGAKRLPELGRGIGRGVLESRDALDDGAHDAGRSIGGIHGRPAAEALTHDNQVAEFYHEDSFRDEKHPRWKRRLFRRFISTLRRMLRI